MSAEPGSSVPLRPAIKSEDDIDRIPPASAPLKAVQIEEPFPDIEEEAQPPKLFRVSSAKRLSGKPASLSRSSTAENSPAMRPADEGSSGKNKDEARQYYSEKFLAQVGDWLEHERRKAQQRKKTPGTRRRKSNSPPAGNEGESQSPSQKRRDRSDSLDSQSSDVSLDRLQHILEESMVNMGFSQIPQFSPRPPSKPKQRRRGSLKAASSDTDYVDGDAIVPSCDAWLDNSKTLMYSGAGLSNEDPEAAASRCEKERAAWATFKNDIIRIAHTLRLKGWRRVPLESGQSINVERLSGALTNAVYVVTPPGDIPDLEGKRLPPKILLRIYGPQVEHLIDRDNELKVLGRLARKKIGPRLLGTFRNGRFEQFFNAITLKPENLRDPETSRQIAKRMRELHDGIDLLPHERENGPGVWRNWDQWLDNVGRIVKHLDTQLQSATEDTVVRNPVVHAWKANGYVCGAPWEQFRDMVCTYRDHLEKVYKSKKAMNERLTFAHNDTQYGNILRIKPDDEKSPLLQPANKHKQLIVIDFEYAAANTPGQEFANHFSEWTYNYHDPVTSYACNAMRYPSLEEQRRFIKAYVDHRPQFPHVSTPRMMAQDSGVSSGSMTPNLSAIPSSSSIVDFMLDARAPTGGWSAAERAREEQSDAQVRELMDETRLWRPVNSAMWVAWGVVQAKVPGLDENNEPVSADVAIAEEEKIGLDEFDYLSYAQSRAMFFWGDCVLAGLIKKEDLPAAVQEQIKIVDF